MTIITAPFFTKKKVLSFGPRIIIASKRINLKQMKKVLTCLPVKINNLEAIILDTLIYDHFAH